MVFLHLSAIFIVCTRMTRFFMFTRHSPSLIHSSFSMVPTTIQFILWRRRCSGRFIKLDEKYLRIKFLSTW